MRYIRLISIKQKSIKEIQSKIHKIDGFKLVSASEQVACGVVAICNLVYEKFFLRIAGYASVNILLVEANDIQTAEIVVAGSGAGLANLDYGIRKKLESDVETVLQECGFELAY